VNHLFIELQEALDLADAVPVDVRRRFTDALTTMLATSGRANDPQSVLEATNPLIDAMAALIETVDAIAGVRSLRRIEPRIPPAD
jgi:hypothetical protein